MSDFEKIKDMGPTGKGQTGVEKCSNCDCFCKINDMIGFCKKDPKSINVIVDDWCSFWVESNGWFDFGYKVREKQWTK